MEKITKTDRIIKDLSFIVDLKEEQVIPESIYKYKLEEGTGEIIGDIKIPCQVYLTFTKYDYEGRYHSHLINASIKHPDPDQKQLIIPKGVHQGLMTMKLGEKSWFNISKKQLPETSGSGLENEGCHFEVIANDIKYKNSDNIESKRMVNERNRQDAKQLVSKKEYQQAIKKYRAIINITEGLEKGKFTEQERQQIQQMNLKAKENYLRCFWQIKNIDKSFDKDPEETVTAYSKLLLEKRSNNVLSLFIRAKVLLKLKYLDESLEYAIKVNQLEPSQDNNAFVQEIKKKLEK